MLVYLRACRNTHTLIFSYFILYIFLSGIAKYYPTRLTLLELHLVLGQRSSLVAEDELHLAELLDQVRVAAQRVVHVLCKEHFHVAVDNMRLQQLHHLHDHVQADRDQLGVRHPVGANLDDEFPRNAAALALHVQVLKDIFVVVHPT